MTTEAMNRSGQTADRVFHWSDLLPAVALSIVLTACGGGGDASSGSGSASAGAGALGKAAAEPAGKVAPPTQGGEPSAEVADVTAALGA